MRLTKPKQGAPCNGCGYCCSMEPCALAKELLGFTTGSCGALETTTDGMRCGLVRNPLGYLFHAARPELGTSPLDPAPNIPEGHQLSVEIATALGMGLGCDAEDDEDAASWELIAST